MTRSNRIRLFIGLIVVAVIVAASTLILSERESQVESHSAEVKSITYTVGSDYAGTVLSQGVKEGDTVKKGQTLMTIQSASLAASHAKMPKSTAYRVSSGGMLTLTATQPGNVQRIGAQVGSFVSAGSAIATIDRSKSLYVLADFRLDPYDFSRIEKGAEVDLILPNQQKLTGKVSRISVKTLNGKADATVEVKSAELVDGTHDGLVAPGTPINATLHLRPDGPLGGLKESFVALLEKIGL